MVKKLEVNLAPSCRDKSLLYRTKIPAVITSFHQRQTMQRSRRQQQRRTTPSSLLHAAEAMQSDSHAGTHDHHYSVPIDKSQREDTLYDHRQGKSVSNQLYNEIESSNVSHSQSFESIDCEEEEEDLEESQSKFHKILQQQVFAWYPTETYNEDELKGETHTASANDESRRQVSLYITELFVQNSKIHILFRVK